MRSCRLLPALVMALTAACAGARPEPVTPPFESFAPLAPELGGLGRETPASARQSDPELCEALASGAQVTVEDVAQGALVALQPEPGRELAAIRERARDVARRFALRLTVAAKERADASCALFDIARADGALMITETADSIRLTFTTADPGRVDALRAAVLAYAARVRPQRSPEEPAGD